MKTIRTLSQQIGMMAVLAIFGGLALTSAVAQTYTELHDFNTSVDPQYLDNYYISQGRDGLLYSLSHFSPNDVSGSNGTVYSMTLAGTPTILTELGPTQGEYPFGGLLLGSDGNFYGTGSLSGSSNFGTVFKVTSTGTMTVLHNFTNGTDGQVPGSPPVQGNDGNYYNVTNGNNGASASTFYKITAAGVFSTVHTFSNAEGAACAYVVLGNDGNFYGACNKGGSGTLGTLYKISSAGTVSVLHNFASADGLNVDVPLVQANDGNFYGLTYEGGSFGFGSLYQLKPNGSFKVLKYFDDGADGGHPNSGLTLGTDGLLYGTTYSGGNLVACPGGCGVIFKVTTVGVFTVLYTPDNTKGTGPLSNLTLDTNGTFYGNMFSGGNFGGGVFYSLNTGLAPFARLVTAQGKVAAKIGILGQGFSNASVVKFAGVSAITKTVTGTTFIQVTVPVGALTGAVTVTTGATTLTTPNSFKVVPTITTFTPASGPVGTVVTINGSGLTQTTAVTFNGLAATSFTKVSDSQITATVPTSATTGKIKVTTSGGSVSSVTNFTVTPAITSFTPASGPVGTLVTINGTSFTGATAVTFNGTSAALFTVVSDSKVTATVPTGATTGKILLTTAGGSATSATNFTVN